MNDFFSIFAVGVTAFAATDIDDIFVLMFLFSSPKFHPLSIVIGQYLGITALVLIGALGSLLALVVPLYIIGLLGFVPIGIGVVKLLQFRKVNDPDDEREHINKVSYLSFLTVAAVTISNGGDNIGIYVPLFAIYHSATEVTLLIIALFVMTGVWCGIAYYLVKHPLIAVPLRKKSNVILPFVLIGIGIYIVVSTLYF